MINTTSEVTCKSSGNACQKRCNTSSRIFGHRSTSSSGMFFLLFICMFSILSTNVNGLNVANNVNLKVTSKSIFLNELNEGRSGNPILSNKNPKNLDILLANMIQDNPTPKPSSTISLQKYSKGRWAVIYAPHIKTLGKVLFSTFSVFYEFYDTGDNTKLGIISNVQYDSKIFGKGWLNTQGIFYFHFYFCFYFHVLELLGMIHLEILHHGK